MRSTHPPNDSDLLQAVEPRPGGQEGVLGHLGRHLPVADDAVGDVDHAGRPAVEQHAEGLPVARLGGAHQLGVVGSCPQVHHPS